MTTISIIDLRNEKQFLTGYKARKYGKLVFVALFDTIIKMDDAEINERIKKYPDMAEFYAEIKEYEKIAEQNLERIKNSVVLLECGDSLEIKIVKKCRYIHPSLHKSGNDENESRRIILSQDEALRNRLKMVQSIISANISNLVKNHSNLVGAESCWINGDVGIRFLVTCKHYIPEGETELPEYINEFRTYVRQSWFKYC